MSLLWIDGELVDKAVARVSPFDHGFLYGDGVWEPLRVFGGRLFRPADHLADLYAAAHAQHLVIPLTPGELTAAIESTVRADARTDGYVRVIISRGPGTIGPDPRKIDPQVVVIAEEYQPFPAELAAHGLHVVTTPDGSDGPSTARTLGQPHVVLAKAHALRAGCLETIFVGHTGLLRGTTEGGMFLVTGDTVRPARPHYPDTHWRTVADMTGTHTKDAEMGEAGIADLLAADEAFLVGTACGVIAVVRVDGAGIGAGTEGPVTRRIREAYRRLTRDPDRMSAKEVGRDEPTSHPGADGLQ